MSRGKTELERYLYGVRRAEKDIDKIKARLTGATPKQLRSPMWVVGSLLYAVWLGFISPRKRSAAGRGYHDKMSGETAKQREATEARSQPGPFA